MEQKCLIEYFWAGIPKQYCHIWNQHLRICLIAKFREKTKMSKFGTKNASFGYFWARISEIYCHIWNLHFRICLIARFCVETKMPKFGTKNALFEYIWPKMPCLCILGLDFFKKLLSYLKSWNQDLRISVVAKFCEETKMPKLRTKNALFGYFWTKMPYLCNFGLEF